MRMMMNNKGEFLITGEYLKFIEFCNVCKEYSYIGVCYGAPGVGKTLSARYYSLWDIIEPVLPPEHLTNPFQVEELVNCDSVFYTAPVSASPVRIEKEIKNVWFNLNRLIGDVVLSKNQKKGYWGSQADYTKLIIIDEADRLKPAALEQIRNIYDTGKISIVLIGMPGIEKKLSRFPQLYSRVGFVHNFKPISKKEIRNVIFSKMNEFKIKYTHDDKETKEACTEIINQTDFNFRKIQRLFDQIDRVMKLNNISNLKKDVVETAKGSVIRGIL
jgi:DNA transposition AAA+ family ATPase